MGFSTDKNWQLSGKQAAYGARQPLVSQSRARIARLIRNASRKWRASEPADYIEFVPVTKNSHALADLAARINWFLPHRRVPIYMEGAASTPVCADLAPYMDPQLVHDPGWEHRRPTGVPEVVLYDVTAKGLARFARSITHATFASAWFHQEGEWDWRYLQEEYCEIPAPGGEELMSQLLARAKSNSSAFILATGPSSRTVDPDNIDTDFRLTCNSAVRDADLITRFAPDVIAFGDPVFHCGPSKYAAAFRRDVARVLAESDALFATGNHWIAPVLAHMPELSARTIVVEHKDIDWRVLDKDDLSVRSTSNILTLVLLPLACALATSVVIAGCDGRSPDEDYFWKHNPRTQYTDELMNSAFAAHPAFFRDRDYVDYYDTHCSELEEFLAMVEGNGESVVCSTPSFIPALQQRLQETPSLNP